MPDKPPVLDFEGKLILGLTVATSLTVGAWAGIEVGSYLGRQEIYRRDHAQAAAGVFIDGADGNKIYKLTPMENLK
jgi:hypothetical protein